MSTFLRKFSVIFIFSAFFVFPSFPQNIQIKYSGNRGYTLVERTNLRRYVNGKYSGLTSREVRSFISAADGENFVSRKQNPVAAKVQWYDGNFYVSEETLRDSKRAAAGIHKAIPSVFYIDSDGQMKMFKDNGYPTFRSFPSYTSQFLKPGDSWKAEAERAVDPLNKGVFTRMPIQVLYTFSGEEKYKGEDVYRIKAIWQTNYGFSNFNRDAKGDESLLKALGGHKADIIVRKATGEAILIVDNVDETFFYSNGQEINFKGTINLFTEYPPAVDRNKLMMTLQRVASVSPEKAPTSSEMKESYVSKISGPDGKNKSGGTKSSNGTKSSKTDNSNQFGKSGGTEPNPLAEKTKNSSSKKSQEEIKSSAKNGNSMPKNNLLVEETSAGLRLSIRDIKFKADSAEILPGESERLDDVARTLKAAPESQFLIEGHTASVGKPSGEQTLSVERAQAVALELSKRGISADKFICKGWGGNKPVADNSTAQGRAQNRRVEITVLE